MMAVAKPKQALHVRPYCCEIDTMKRGYVHVDRFENPRYAIFKDRLYVWAPHEVAAASIARKLLNKLFLERDGAAVWVDFLAVYPDMAGYAVLQKARELRQAGIPHASKTKRRVTSYRDLPLFRTTGV